MAVSCSGSMEVLSRSMEVLRGLFWLNHSSNDSAPVKNLQMHNTTTKFTEKLTTQIQPQNFAWRRNEEG